MSQYSIYFPVYYSDYSDEDKYQTIEDAENFQSALVKVLANYQDEGLLNLKIVLQNSLRGKLRRNKLIQNYIKSNNWKWLCINFDFENPKHISDPTWGVWEKIRLLQICASIARPNMSVQSYVFYTVDGEFIEKLRGIVTNIPNSVAHHLDQNEQWPLIHSLDIWQTWEWVNNFPSFFRNLSKCKIGRALNAYTQLFHTSFSIETTVSDFFWSMIALEAIYTDSHTGVNQALFDKIFLVLGKPTNFHKQIKEIYNYRSRLLHGQLEIPGKFSYDNDDEDIDRHLKLVDSEDSSVCLIVATLQYLVMNNIKEIEFSRKYDLVIK